jgi:hypothetical protein
MLGCQPQVLGQGDSALCHLSVQLVETKLTPSFCILNFRRQDHFYAALAWMEYAGYCIATAKIPLVHGRIDGGPSHYAVSQMKRFSSSTNQSICEQSIRGPVETVIYDFVACILVVLVTILSPAATNSDMQISPANGINSLCRDCPPLQLWKI